MKELLEFYQENDYVVVPDALSPDEVHTINEIIDRDPLRIQQCGLRGRMDINLNVQKNLKM